MGALLLTGALATDPLPPPEQVIAFINVSVIPMDRERVLAGQTVLVRGARISAMGPVGQVRVPSEAVRIDGRGKYLIPGLGDMHVHLSGSLSQFDSVRAEGELFLYLANGVTTVRNMYGAPPHLRLRARAAAGELLSPLIYTASPVDALSRVPPAGVAAAVTELKAAGYDFIKLGGTEAEGFDSIIAAARRLGMPVAGHVPVRLERIFAAGYASIEHLTGYLPGIVLDDSASIARAGQLLDSAALAALAAATRRAGVWNTPTQAIAEHYLPALSEQALRQRPEMRHVTEEQFAGWTGMQWLLGLGYGRTHAVRRQIIRALRDAGAGLLLGTDAPGAYNVPGFSVHRELEALVAAGLTPYEALVTGTRNVAAFFGTLDSTGTVAAGKRADLVLVAGNPLEDIRYTAEIAGVMRGGRWLGRGELDAGLNPLAVRPPPPPPPSPPPGPATAFVDVSVVPMDRERVLTGQTVLVRGDRIVAMGPAARLRVPAEAVRVDAQGKFLIPGLGDMHVHIPDDTASGEVGRVLFLYLANGVTTVRNMYSGPVHLALRKQVATGKLAGPRIYAALQLKPESSPARVARMVQEAQAAGYDAVKVREFFPRDVFDTLVATARRLGVPVVGHVPPLPEVGLERALAAPYASIEHLDTYLEYLIAAGDPAWATAENTHQYMPDLRPDNLARIDTTRISAVAGMTRRAGVWTVTTLALDRDLATHSATASRWAEVRYIPLPLREAWKRERATFAETVWRTFVVPQVQGGTTTAAAHRWLRIRQQVVKALQDAGAGLLLGTDDGAMDLTPVRGFKVHRELAALVEAGLTPYQALATGTRNVAAFLGTGDSTGTVAVGKRADLVLLDGNPLADIYATGRVAGVMYGGRWLSQAEIATGISRLGVQWVAERLGQH